MIFNSLEFIIFFAITAFLYFVIPRKYQKYFLLISSLLFYSYYIPWHVLILILIVLLNYYYGILAGKGGKKYRRYFLIGILILNISFLLSFKYLNFFNSNLSALAGLIGWNYSAGILEIIIPLGISFYIFKCISYDIEVYRNNIAPEKNLSIFMLYIVIYPELLAGPIDRPQNLLRQLRQTYGFDYRRITNGLKLMAWGFFQKWVIADRLALLVNRIYDSPHDYNGLGFAIATFFFTVQIYCDFSAYSDIAIGAGQVLGFNFMQNFNRPYFSKSISEFWRRWHISLSTWLRDYLFLPIAYTSARKLKNSRFLGIRPEVWSYSIATLATMFIAGLWHGANLTYIAWGSLMGIYLVMSFYTKKLRKYLLRLTRISRMKKIHSVLAMGFTFSLVCFSWIFFRAQSLGDAIYIITHIHTGILDYARLFVDSVLHFRFSRELIVPLTFGFHITEMALDVAFIGILVIVQIIQSKVSIIKLLSEKPLILRWAIYLILIGLILVYGRFENTQFIYLQF